MRYPQLHVNLIPVDALGKRWSAWGEQRAKLHPLERYRLLRDGAVLGGGATTMPADIKAWDEILCDTETPPDKAALLKLWYSHKRMWSHEIANRLNISRATVYTYRNEALWFMLGCLKGRKIKL